MYEAFMFGNIVVRFFGAKGKRYSRNLMASLALLALTVCYHETRRAEREMGMKAAAITAWR